MEESFIGFDLLTPVKRFRLRKFAKIWRMACDFYETMFATAASSNYRE
jgi:hypothetical protein